MSILDLAPQSNDLKARKWEIRLASEVRCRVRNERAIGMKVDRLDRHAMHRYFLRGREQDAVAIIAELAGVQWLYNPNTGEVRFFEFQ